MSNRVSFTTIDEAGIHTGGNRDACDQCTRTSPG